MFFVEWIGQARTKLIKWLLNQLGIDHQYIAIIIKELRKREAVASAIEAYCERIEAIISKSEDDGDWPIPTVAELRQARTIQYGYTYFIFDESTRSVKIGFSSSPRDRLKNLQTGNAAPLKLVATVWGSRQTEMIMHDRFAKDRLSGEWFALSEELTSHIVELRRR